MTADLYQFATERMQDDAAAKLGAALLGAALLGAALLGAALLGEH
jgi:hypothetical protein